MLLFCYKDSFGYLVVCLRCCGTLHVASGEMLDCYTTCCSFWVYQMFQFRNTGNDNGVKQTGLIRIRKSVVPQNEVSTP